MLYHIDIKITVVLVQVPLEVSVAELVEIFVLAEVFRLLLDSIIGEMDELIPKVGKVKLSTARSDVAILVEVASDLPVDTCQQGKYSEVKFSSMYQQRVVDVLLDYVGVLLTASSSHPDQAPYFAKALGNIDSDTSIRVLSWFHNP